jgi:adenylate cyclase
MLRRLLPTLIGFAAVMLLLALRIADPYPVQVLREIGFDLYERLAPRPQGDFPVRVVDIDEASLAEFGQWPWPRDRLAALTDRLNELGAAAIGFDVLFPEADRMSPRRIAAEVPGLDAGKLPDTDAEFAAALGRSPSILGLSRSPGGAPLTIAPKSSFAISGPDPRASIPHIAGAAVPLPQLHEAARGLAALSLETGATAGTVRALPLLWTNGTSIFPSLPLESLRVAMGVPTMVVFGDTAAEGYVEGVRVGDFTVPTTSSGELWLYYSRPRPDLMVSARDVLGPGYAALADRIAGHIVLIGTSASGLLDLHTTTLGDNVAGVTIHAQAIEQILAQSFLTRPDWAQGLEWVEFAAIGALMVLVVLRLGPLAGLLFGAGGLGLSVGFSWWMFANNGVMLDPSFPAVGLTLVYGALVFLRFMTTDADRRQIRQAFGYYVAPALLTEIEHNRDRLKLGGELRTITVMFTDMRGFTPFSEQLTPQRILNVLNTLFGATGAEITRTFGTIDKFIGDAIMAFWNAPVDVPDHAHKAVEAALGMRQRLAALNAADAFRLRADGGPVGEIAIGMGISTGEAVVGNMGLETRFDYSALGDTVNVASRVESACKELGYDVVVADATRQAAPDFAYLEAGAVSLKGKRQRLAVHVVVGDPALAGSTGFRDLQAAHGKALALLKAGREPGEAIAACLALANTIEPGLATFYGKLSERRADFAEAQDEAAE